MSDPRTPTYEQLSALCAQMAAALESIRTDHANQVYQMGEGRVRRALADVYEVAGKALTAYRTLSPDPQWQRVPKALRELDALTEALTPSAGTKAAYSGEFYFMQRVIDGNDNEIDEPVAVPWTTVKEIMSAILNRARGEG